VVDRLGMHEVHLRTHTGSRTCDSLHPECFQPVSSHPFSGK
jgi:hypothetical protein